jgi:hypothetical protein
MFRMLALRVPTGQAEGACKVDDRPCDFKIEGHDVRLRYQGAHSPEWQSWTIVDSGAEPEVMKRDGTTILRLLPKPE